MSPQNINRQAYSVSRSDRETLHNHKSFLIWFTGLSGSGKSTIANLLEKQLNQQKIHTYTLDGDNLRNGLNKNLTFSKEDRNENLRRTAEVSKLFVDAGTVVLAAFISPFKKTRDEIKNIVGNDNYIEVFVNTTLEVCEKRDVKGLYKKARAGEIKDFTGISSDYEAPSNPDIEILTAEENPSDAVEKIMKFIKNKL